jgi:hypothetical protein
MTEHVLQIFQLTPRSRDLLGKLIIPQLLKRFPAYYGTWNSITLFTDPYPESRESTPHLPIMFCLIFSFHLHLGLPSELFPSGFLYKTFYSFRYHACCILCSLHPFDLIVPIIFDEECRLWKSSFSKFERPYLIFIWNNICITVKKRSCYEGATSVSDFGGPDLNLSSKTCYPGIFYVFQTSLQANARVMPQIKPRALPFTSC